MRRNPFNEPILTATPLRLALLAGSLSAVSATAAVESFDDITHWVGSGANESALVIDFNDGSAVDSFAWGYRWDGTASGAQMILDIAQFDPLLSIVSSGDASNGFFLSSITYDERTAADDYISVPNEGWGYYLAGGTSGVSSFDEDYDPNVPQPQIWNYANGGTDLPSSWEVSKAGASEVSGSVQGRLLADGAWDSWSFGEFDPSFNHLGTPSGPVTAAPEPSAATLWLALVAAFVSLAAGRRTHSSPSAPSPHAHS